MNENFLRRYVLISHLLLACSIGHISLNANGFYDIVITFLSNKTCTAILYNYLFLLFMLACKVPIIVFLGQLSQLEAEQLMESARNYVMDAVLFLVLSKPRYNGKEIVITELIKYLTFLVALKCFHILLYIRLSHMFQELPSYFKLFRVCSFIYALSMLNCYFLGIFWIDLSWKNTFSIWIVFEILGMLQSCIFCALKYIINVVDFYYENGLTNKTTLLFYIELVHDVISLSSFSVFMIIFFMHNPNNVPAYMLIDILHVARNLSSRIRMLLQYRRIARALDYRFPCPTEEELQNEPACIICRDKLDKESRKIDCGHIFHLACLKSWLFQHSSCPTCRSPISSETESNQSTELFDASRIFLTLENTVRRFFRRTRVVEDVAPGRAQCGKSALQIDHSIAKNVTIESLIVATGLVVQSFFTDKLICKVGVGSSPDANCDLTAKGNYATESSTSTELQDTILKNNFKNVDDSNSVDITVVRLPSWITSIDDDPNIGICNSPDIIEKSTAKDENLSIIEVISLPEAKEIPSAAENSGTETDLHLLLLQSYVEMLRAWSLAIKCYIDLSDESCQEILFDCAKRMRGAKFVKHGKGVFGEESDPNEAENLIKITEESVKRYHRIFMKNSPSYAQAVSSLQTVAGEQFPMNLSKKLILDMSIVEAIVHLESYEKRDSDQ